MQMYSTNIPSTSFRTSIVVVGVFVFFFGARTAPVVSETTSTCKNAFRMFVRDVENFRFICNLRAELNSTELNANSAFLISNFRWNNCVAAVAVAKWLQMIKSFVLFCVEEKSMQHFSHSFGNECIENGRKYSCIEFRTGKLTLNGRRPKLIELLFNILKGEEITRFYASSIVIFEKKKTKWNFGH